MLTLAAPGVDTGASQTITLDGDRSGDVHAGDRVPATTWNGTLVAAAILGESRPGPDQPDNVANHRMIAEVTALLAALVCGRAVAWQVFRCKVDPRRFERADFVLMPLALLTVTAALSRQAPVAAILSVTSVAVLALSCLAYPFLPWVRKWSPVVYGKPEEPDTEPHPDWDMSNRPVGKKLW